MRHRFSDRFSFSIQTVVRTRADRRLRTRIFHQRGQFFLPVTPVRDFTVRRVEHVSFSMAVVSANRACNWAGDPRKTRARRVSDRNSRQRCYYRWAFDPFPRFFFCISPPPPIILVPSSLYAENGPPRLENAGPVVVVVVARVYPVVRFGRV